METIPITDISPSPLNPRGSMDPIQLRELIDSVRAHGVLQPIVVRNHRDPKKDGYEVVCGHRRLAAARAAELEVIPAIVRQMSDEHALEIQLIENLQRSDIHPLDEAQGYHELLRQPGYTKDGVGKIAARVGRSVKYVYDRVKLLTLSKEAKKVFLEGKITAGHAILLARLSPADQARALKVEKYGAGGLFEREQRLFSNGDDQEEETLKTRSVRELQHWIDDNIKLDPAAPITAELFPETHAAVAAAPTVLQLTHEWQAPRSIGKAGASILPRDKWKRADGQEKSKRCGSSALGVLVIGPGRGEAFDVCTDATCKVHWKEEQRIAASRNASAAKEKRVHDPWMKREEARRAGLKVREARWKKARPAIVDALEAVVLKASVSATGVLADAIVRGVNRYGGKMTGKVPRGKTAEDLVRHVAFIVLHNEATGYAAHENFPAKAKALGIDTAAILKQHAPPEKPKKKAAKRKKAAK